MSNTTETQQEHREMVMQPPTRNAIVLWYHEADFDLLRVLDPYLQLTYRRLGSQIKRSYFGYPNAKPKPPAPYTGPVEFLAQGYQEQQAHYEQERATSQKKQKHAVVALKRALLFIPCVSNRFIEDYWTHMESDPVLAELLAHPDFAILPVVVRPTETASASASRPLCTYEGHHLETACQQIARCVETMVRDGYGGDLQEKQTPLSTLFSSPATVQAVIASQTQSVDVLVQRALATLTPIQALLEQTSTRMVSAQQTALTERSERTGVEAELRLRIAHMQQQITTMQQHQQASLFHRLVRLFHTSS